MHDLKKNKRKQRCNRQSYTNPMSYYFERQRKLSGKNFQKSLKAHLREIFKLGIHNSFPENTNKYVLFSEGGDCIGR